MVPDVKTLIAQAAYIKQTTVSNFMIESSVGAAQAVLADRTRFVLSGADWKKFTAALDAPLKTNAALSKLLKNRSVFDR